MTQANKSSEPEIEELAVFNLTDEHVLTAKNFVREYEDSGDIRVEDSVKRVANLALAFAKLKLSLDSVDEKGDI